MNAPVSLLAIRGRPWEGVQYGCSTREGGVSQGAWHALNLGLNTHDNPLSVTENRERLAGQLPSEPVWLQQVHDVQVFDADTPGAGTSATAPMADAAVTTLPGRVLAVLTADCVPVVMADLNGSVLGVAHAGWRGLAAGVIDAVFQAMRQRRPTARGWQAWIGPCIGQARFEVGDDVHSAFVDTDSNAARYFRPGVAARKWQADLAGLTRHRLEMLGVQNIEISGLCTYDRADLFYSYRRDKVTGRMATLAWLEGRDGPHLP